MSKPSPELLIDMYFDGTLTEEHGQMLTAWLKQSPDNVAYFVDCASIHAALRRQHIVRNIGQTRRDVLGSVAGLSPDDVLSEERVNEKLSEIELAELPEIPEPHVEPTHHRADTQTAEQPETKTVLNLPGLRVYRTSTGSDEEARPVWRLPGLAVAAMLLIGLIVLFAWPEEPGPPPTIATLTNQHRLDWLDQTVPINPGHKLIAGRYAFHRGFAELQMARGATLVLEGPCDFELLNDNALYLHHGRMTASVPESAKLFTVNTPHWVMVDYGTEFGVDFDGKKGRTTAAVFKGLVEVVTNNDDDKEPQKLMLSARQQVSADRSEPLPQAPDPLHHAHRFIRSIEESRDLVECSGQVEFYRVPPANVSDQRLITPERAVLFREREGAELKETLEDVITASGEYQFLLIDSPFKGAIPAGTVADSYLLHFDSGNIGHVRSCSLTLRFPRPVIGVLTTHHHLDETDRNLGHPDTVYRSTETPIYKDNPNKRGVDWLDRDYIKISKDRLTVTFQLSAERMDQARILIESE